MATSATLFPTMPNPDNKNNVLVNTVADGVTDLCAETMRHLAAVGGTLTTDDSVLNKPYAFKMD